jgi:hypothetical protein
MQKSWQHKVSSRLEIHGAAGILRQACFDHDAASPMRKPNKMFDFSAMV